MRFIVLVDVPVLSEDRNTDTTGEVESAFYDPDMDDSIAEAIGRYTGDVVDACVLAVKRTRRQTLRGI